jgi:hypothetical protein
VLKIYEALLSFFFFVDVKVFAILQRNAAFLAIMTKVSWSCIELTCCEPNCTAPCFHRQLSTTTASPYSKLTHGLPSPLSPSAPFSAFTPFTPTSCSSAHPNMLSSASCCGKKHKHFLYSIVLPTSGAKNASSTRSKSALQSPGSTTPSSAYTDYTAPIITPTTPPERPSLRARRDTLSKLKIPQSPPLSSPPLIPTSPAPRSSPVRPQAMYPDMFLPMPGMQTGSGMGSGSRQVSPLSTTYTPYSMGGVMGMNMSPISPLVLSNNPSPIIGAA